MVSVLSSVSGATLVIAASLYSNALVTFPPLIEVWENDLRWSWCLGQVGLRRHRETSASYSLWKTITSRYHSEDNINSLLAGRCWAPIPSVILYGLDVGMVLSAETFKLHLLFP